MNKEVIIKQGTVTRPFEARIVSEELRERVQFFQKLLTQKSKSIVIKNKVKKF